MVSIPNPFNPSPRVFGPTAVARQSSNPGFKNIQDFVKQALNLQRSNSLIVRPKLLSPDKPDVNPEQPNEFKKCLDQHDKSLVIGGSLGLVKQESAPTDSLLDLSHSMSLSSLNLPGSELLRSQSLRLTDRSNAFKSYAKPLVLNQPN